MHHSFLISLLRTGLLTVQTRSYERNARTPHGKLLNFEGRGSSRLTVQSLCDRRYTVVRGRVCVIGWRGWYVLALLVHTTAAAPTRDVLAEPERADNADHPEQGALSPWVSEREDDDDRPAGKTLKVKTEQFMKQLKESGSTSRDRSLF